jgi:hypothetical protein
MNYDRTRLALLIRRTLEKNGNETAQDFALRYKTIDGKNGLNASIISRILNKKSNANRETLRKIAVLVLQRDEASAEDLLQLASLQEEMESREPLKIGSGFTSWAAYPLAVVNTQHDNTIKDSLTGIQFVFCDKGTGDKREPYWVENDTDIEQLRVHPELFKHKYIVEELHNLLLEGRIDCALLLRKSFEELNFPEKKRPVLVSRILVGSGTSMYMVQKGKAGGASRNEMIPMPDYDSVREVKRAFCDLIRGERVRILVLDNASIVDDKARLLSDPEIAKALNGLRGQDTIQKIDEGDYDSTIKRLAEGLTSGHHQDDNNKSLLVDVLLIIGFAPLNQLMYEDLLSKTPGLTYRHYNLSKMVDVKSSYGLYARPDVLEDLPKLMKIRDFILALDHYVGKMKTKENLVKEISVHFSDLYYQDDTALEGGNNKFERMNRDLEELEYSNSSLDLVRTLVGLLERKIK